MPDTTFLELMPGSLVSPAYSEGAARARTKAILADSVAWATMGMSPSLGTSFDHSIFLVC